MLIFYKKAKLAEHINKNLKNRIIGFVPTMGALHNGHLSLILDAVKQNDVVIVSIFVNPTQFNNIDDLKKYPRNLEKDIKLIEQFNKEIIIYSPEVEDVYDEGQKSEKFNFDGLENQMEGKFRLGHFDGVATVVKFFFELIKPKNAYFGEKDFQQLQIIKTLVKKYNIPVKIVACPVFREKNGLAMSSRNERLSIESRQKAGIIYQILLQSKKQFGTKSAKEVTTWVENEFKKYPEFELEYFQIADEEKLKPCIRKLKNKKYRAFIAVFLDNVRLIDTISLN
ncbi:MAG TPA: pantoate--beta-alanine ligase [Flavobacterium sp.]|nr:pantoate--beta-alanine ligase [Flavobacterium sp.]